MIPRCGAAGTAGANFRTEERPMHRNCDHDLIHDSAETTRVHDLTGPHLTAARILGWVAEGSSKARLTDEQARQLEELVTWKATGAPESAQDGPEGAGPSPSNPQRVTGALRAGVRVVGHVAGNAA